MMICKENTQKILKEFNIPENSKICVALSGGADSVCLISVLNSIKQDLSFELSAVHINHNLRGAESYRDSVFCAELCERLNIKLHTYSINVVDNMKDGEGIELAARRLRYDIFEKLDADFIATAHTAEDSLETFIINFSRGSGLRGLCGIPSNRGKFIRPLYKFSRADIENYCTENSLSYVTDSSNLTDDYTRNKIRHHIIPHLKNMNPSVISVSQRNLELLKQDNNCLDGIAKEFFKQFYDKNKGLSIEAFSALHFAIASRIIMDYFHLETQQTLDYNHLMSVYDLCKKGRGRTQLSGSYFAEVKKGKLLIRASIHRCFNVTTEIIPKEIFEKRCKINNLLLKNAIDYGKITGKLSLRTRLAGDSIHPIGRGVTKQLRKIQAERNINYKIRPKLPVASDDSGVVWSYMIGADERVKIDNNTLNVLIFKIDEN